MTDSGELPTFADVQAAADRIAPHLHRTPVMTSDTLDRELELQAFFKCENLQKVGAFKARGALNAVLAGRGGFGPGGVITHSSGNHAQAVANAARIAGIPCCVVMPDDAPSVKRAAVVDYGADIVSCTRENREEVCAREAESRGATVIHPFENAHVIAGQGTAALELLEQVPDLDAVITPVGGGGLLAGTALVVSAQRPEAEVFGAEPEAVDDAYRSMQTGVRQPKVENPVTLADGLMTGLGRPNFAILQQHGVEILLCSERAMLEGAFFHLQRMKLVCEPSCGVALGALRTHAERFRGQRVGLVLSGGNTDFGWLAEMG